MDMNQDSVGRENSDPSVDGDLASCPSNPQVLHLAVWPYALQNLDLTFIY